MSEPIVDEGLREGKISPWFPEPNTIRLLALGKLAEEAGEVATRAARCIIQGLDSVDPDTGRTNREELQRELADVDAASNALMVVAPHVVHEPDRRTRKFLGFLRWFDMIRNALEEQKK